MSRLPDFDARHKVFFDWFNEQPESVQKAVGTSAAHASAKDAHKHTFLVYLEQARQNMPVVEIKLSEEYDAVIAAKDLVAEIK